MVRSECLPLRRVARRGLSPSQLPVCAFCAVLHQLQDEGEQVPVHGLHLYDVCAAEGQSQTLGHQFVCPYHALQWLVRHCILPMSIGWQEFGHPQLAVGALCIVLY